MAGRSGVNKQAIRKISREIEREFAKNPVRVPLEADSSGVTFQPAATVNNYHGPVVTVNGDNAQIAWDNNTVSQAQNRIEQIAPGYEELTSLVTDLLANLNVFALDEDATADVRVNSEAVLSEVVKEKPDQTAIKRGVTMIKGILGSAAAAGLGQAVAQKSAEAALHMIKALGNAMPF